MFFAFRRSLKPFFGLMISALGVPTIATADPLQDGLASYNRGEYQTAKRLLDPLAAEGDADAQLALGLMFTKGEGVEADLAAALNWFERAVDNSKASPRVHDDATYNRDFLLKKKKEWADSDRAAAVAAQVDLAGKIQALKAAQDAAERRRELEEAQIDRARASAGYMKRQANYQREAARSRLLLEQQRRSGRWAY